MKKGDMAKIRNNRIKWIILLFGLVSLLSIGCSEEQAIGTPTVDASGNAVMRISVRAAGVSTEVGNVAENAIRSLRVFFFTQDNSLFATQYYEDKDLMSSLPTDPKKAYDYFIKDGDSYVISKLFKKEVPLKIIVVANELSSLTGVTKIDDIKGTVLRYYDNYNSNGKLDINIAGSGGTNRGYIPMYSETGLMSVYEWDASNGKDVKMNLERALAKVTLKIKKGDTFSDVSGKGKLEIASASIVNVPRRAWLDRSDLGYSDTYVSTLAKNFGTHLVIEPTTTGDVSTDVLTFYIPEHNLVEAAFNNGIYTYIQVNGEFTEADGSTKTNTSYQIPLGDGVSAYNGGSIDVGNLSLKDLHISKNTSYQVVASVATKGKLERFEVKVTPKEWENPENIEANLGIPYLNVTSLHVDMSEKRVNVYFWTNQDKPYIGEDGVMKDENQSESLITVNTVFKDLSCSLGNTTTHFDYKALSKGGYTGSMIFEFDNDDRYENIATYKLTLHAGELTRTIEVNSNPIIGKVVFDGNGGKIESEDTYMKEIRYADWPGTTFFGGEYEIASPSYTSPAADKEFLMWVYSGDERQVDVDNDGKLKIIIGGYITGIKALWK
ncbi:fimbrial protein [uncultured Parabacteroides sp.]|jgi:hypothetical protein|uniref:fimbrial protein n=1 Tax=uncultured Parabacteroides sp. TaxID=512312 RepID=UPI0025DD5FD7|nr:fimbrial protein [uncultured Parabacteroides sp.]